MSNTSPGTSGEHQVINPEIIQGIGARVAARCFLADTIRLFLPEGRAPGAWTDAIRLLSCQQAQDETDDPAIRDFIMPAITVRDLHELVQDRSPWLKAMASLQTKGVRLHVLLYGNTATVDLLVPALKKLMKIGIESCTILMHRTPGDTAIGHFDYWCHPVHGYAVLVELKEYALSEGVGTIRFAYSIEQGMEFYEFTTSQEYQYSSPGIRRVYTPLIAVTKPNGSCNSNCIFCGLRKGTYRQRHSAKEFLSPEDWVRFVHEARDIGFEHILWSGGEFVMYKDFNELIDLLGAERGITQSMDTNCIALTEEKAERLIQNGIREFHFSIDAGFPDINDRIRGKIGATEAVMQALKTCERIGASEHQRVKLVHLNTVITKPGFSTLPELLELDLAHPVVNFHSFSFLEGAYHYKDASMTIEGIRQFKQSVIPRMIDIVEKRPFQNENMKKRAVNNILRMYTNEAASDEEYSAGIYWKDTAMVRMFCQVPNFFTLIIQNGDVMPCTGVEEFGEPFIGNILEKSFREIWDSPEYDHYRQYGADRCKYCPLHHNVNLTYYVK